MAGHSAELHEVSLVQLVGDTGHDRAHAHRTPGRHVDAARHLAVEQGHQRTRGVLHVEVVPDLVSMGTARQLVTQE